MIYSDIMGKVTNEYNFQNSFNLTKENYKDIAEIISEVIKTSKVLFCNIKIPYEISQYDVLFSLNFINQGLHQRGILSTDLLIGVVGYGFFGFENNDNPTEEGYYTDKLGVCSYLLFKLFNEIRKRCSK